jgi:hypothetical protein
MKNLLHLYKGKQQNNSSNKKAKKIFFGALIGFLILVLSVGIFGFIAIYQPLMKVQTEAQKLMAEANLLKDDVRANDIDLIKNRISKISNAYSQLEKESSSLYWAQFIPYVADFKHGIEAGRYTIEAGKKGVDAIYPYADLIGFKQGEQGFLDKTAEDRLQTAVLTLDKMVAQIDDVSKNIELAEKKIEMIDPSRYPESVLSRPVRPVIEDLKSQFQGMANLFVDAQPLLKELPNILGAKEEKNYLILFQNTAERRATGGFYTFFAVFNVNKGKLSIKDSSDIYDLDNSISNHPPAPEKIKLYHKNVSRFFIRDSNLSPDYAESLKLFDSLYQKAGRRVDYDGVITMDSKVLVDMLQIFGDTQVNGINFSAQTDKRCDCPQVIYSLFDIVDRPVNYIKVDRKRILGNLMLELFYKAIGFSPSKYWGQMAQAMFINLDQKHILLSFTDPNAQKAVEKLNYSGRIRESESDYLHINSVNFAGAKSNMFIDEEIDSETSFENGKVRRKVTIKFINPHKHSDCNLERGGLCLNATLRNWIRFYVPEGSDLISFKGSKTKTLTYDELGKTVFEGFMTVNPEGMAIVSIEYELPKNITKDNYSLYIQKQPGVENQKINVSIAGKKVFDKPLLVDTTL